MRKLENGALIAVVHDCERERADAVAGGAVKDYRRCTFLRSRRGGPTRILTKEGRKRASHLSFARRRDAGCD